MDIKSRLEAEHSKALTSAIVKYVGSNKKRFLVLMDVFLSSEYRLCQRAAWPLSYVALEHPQLVTPFIGKLVKKIEEPGNHPAIARNILRIFEDIDIPKRHHGHLIDICFRLMMDETKPVAIRAFALSTALNISRPYPELKNEFRLLLNELSQLPQTPAIRQRVKRALRELQRAG